MTDVINDEKAVVDLDAAQPQPQPSMASDELVRQPFQRLIEKGALLAHKCTGFWQCMDTFKDKQCLEELNQSKAPWKVWNHISAAVSNESTAISASA